MRLEDEIRRIILEELEKGELEDSDLIGRVRNKLNEKRVPKVSILEKLKDERKFEKLEADLLFEAAVENSCLAEVLRASIREDLIKCREEGSGLFFLPHTTFYKLTEKGKEELHRLSSLK